MVCEYCKCEIHGGHREMTFNDEVMVFCSMACEERCKKQISQGIRDEIHMELMRINEMFSHKVIRIRRLSNKKPMHTRGKLRNKKFKKHSIEKTWVFYSSYVKGE